MGKIATLTLMLALGACSAFSVGKTAVAVKGAEVADEVLTTAEWTLCEVATRGSLKRRYGTSIERAKAYKEFCDGNSTVNFIEPE